MDSRWFWVVLSTLALVGGFGVLLVFINFFAVPHMLTGDFIPTMCTLISIKVSGAEGEHLEKLTLLPEQEARATGGAPVTDTLRSVTDRDQQGILPHTDSNLKKPKEGKKVGNNLMQEASRTRDGAANEVYPGQVQWKSSSQIRSPTTATTDGDNYKGHIRDPTGDKLETDSSQRRSLMLTTDAMLTGTAEDMTSPNCVQLKVTYKDVNGGSVKANDVFDSPWTYYNVMYGQEKCLCPDCVSEDGAAVALKGRRLVPGDTFPCLYGVQIVGGQERRQVLASRNSIGLVLNIMLWPTLVFIIGFVGIMFACLYVQRDDWAACPCRNTYWV